MNRFAFIVVALLVTGCAGFNQAMTPSAKTSTNTFDGSIDVVQGKVSAASSLNEEWNTLGFRWSSKYPDQVVIDVGTAGITSVTDATFNIDGEIIEFRKPAAPTDVEINIGRYANMNWSERGFIMPLATFRQMATAKVVKMKVGMPTSYAVSSFGQSLSSAVVSGKFRAFVEQIDANYKK